MSEYTPDTAQVRSGWVYGAREIGVPEDLSGPQFDRWLDGIKKEERMQGLLDAAELVVDSVAQGLGMQSAVRVIKREAGHYG